MKIKLNRVKMLGLFELIEFLMDGNQAENDGEQILYLLVEKIRIKLRNRLDQLSLKDNYQITLSEDEALALKVWLEQKHIPANYFNYELNVAQQICLDINKQYGRNFKAVTGLRELAAGSSGS